MEASRKAQKNFHLSLPHVKAFRDFMHYRCFSSSRRSFPAIMMLVLYASHSWASSLPKPEKKEYPPFNQAAVLQTSWGEPMNLSLQQAETYALEHHPRIAAAAVRAAAALQGISIAQADLLPQINGNAVVAKAENDVSRLGAAPAGLTSSGIRSRQSDGLYLSQLIFDFGRTPLLISTSRLEAKSGKERLDAARALVLLNVDRSYFAALGSEALVKVAQQQVDTHQVLYEQIKTLAASKLRSDLDLRLEEANLAQARLMLVDTQGRKEEAMSDLAAAIGSEREPNFILTDTEEIPSLPISLGAVLADALALRPDLISLRYDRDAAFKRAAASKAARLPSITGIAAGGISPYEAQNSGLAHDYGMFGVNVSLPIFTGGRLTAQQKQAELQAQALRDDVIDQETSIIRSVRNAWIQVKTSFLSIGVADNFAAAANSSFELAQSLYSVGSSSIVELNQADLQRIQAEISAITARYDYRTKRSALAYESGKLK
jgi:outer membrane protein